MSSSCSTVSALASTALCALLSMGCSTSSASGGVSGGGHDAGSAACNATAGEVYVPYPNDFCNYTSWTKYVEPDAGGDGVFPAGPGTDGGFIHVGGGRIEFINKVPPHGCSQFPVGTIIVKQIPAQQQIFAMAKVGGDYNTNGPNGAALNWEWFELPPGDCPVGFVWQGSIPPSNQAYGGNPQACNACHSGFPENDYVASPKILLKDY